MKFWIFTCLSFLALKTFGQGNSSDSLYLKHYNVYKNVLIAKELKIKHKSSSSIQIIRKIKNCNTSSDVNKDWNGFFRALFQKSSPCSTSKLKFKMKILNSKEFDSLYAKDTSFHQENIELYLAKSLQFKNGKRQSFKILSKHKKKLREYILLLPNSCFVHIQYKNKFEDLETQNLVETLLKGKQGEILFWIESFGYFGFYVF